MRPSIPVRVQYRHVHLSARDMGVLFGDRQAGVVQDLPHRGQHVSEHSVRVVGKGGVELERVAVLGPSREETQVELSPTEAHALGISAPVRVSGDTARSGGCTLVGPHGTVVLKSGVIIPARHLHCSDRDAAALGVTHDQVVAVAPTSRPSERIESVTVRVHPTFALELHVSYDEASEYWLQTGDTVQLL